MKINSKALIFLLAITALITISGCGGDPTPAPSVEEQQLEKLTGTWAATGNSADVTLSGQSKKADYASFQLVVTGTPGATSFGYSVSGRPTNSPWLANGTWIFGTDPETKIIRDADKPNDKLDITYSISSDGKTMQLNFNFAGTGYPARVSNVTGDWVFTLTKI